MDDAEQPARYEPLEGIVTEGGVLLPDGRRLSTSSAPSPTSTAIPARVISPLTPRSFAVCPICLSTAPTSDEHVPPRSLGGTRMTKTCNRCNNEFGRLEAALASTHLDEIPFTRFAGGPVRGARHAGGVRLRTQPDGSFVLIVDGLRSDPAIGDILRSGSFQMDFLERGDAALRAALLKSAYLATCLMLGDIPSSPDSDAVRRELLAAIDDPTRTGQGPGHHAGRLVVLRLFAEPPHPLYACTAERAGTTIWGFGLGTFGFASWPIPDLLEAARPSYEGSEVARPSPKPPR